MLKATYLKCVQRDCVLKVLEQMSNVQTHLAIASTLALNAVCFVFSAFIHVYPHLSAFLRLSAFVHVCPLAIACIYLRLRALACVFLNLCLSVCILAVKDKKKLSFRLVLI